MKLLSYVADGAARYGVVTARGDGVIDVSTRLDGAPTLRDLIEQDRLREVDDSASADHELDAVEYALPITEPRKILCAGRNYAGYHEVTERPPYPSIFGRFASSFSSHRQPIWAPEAGDELDYEGELVAVIGKRGRHIAEDAALDYVVGYTCMNEGTVRDWMKKGTQNTPAKNFYRSGGLGPWIVTADELPDPAQLRITTRRNGDVVQDGGTDRMLFSIPYLIAHVSKFTFLEAGDLIATGSPGGSAVDGDPPVWLRDGDVIDVDIAGVGTLSNPVAAERVVSSRR